MLAVEGDPAVTDVVLVPSPYPHSRAKAQRPVDYFRHSYFVAGDLLLANIESSFADEILDACSVTGMNFSPVRQFGAPYGFVRVAAPHATGAELHFDPDGRLAQFVALSRLVHPTSVGLSYAARVRRWANGNYQIIPYRARALNPHAFVTDVDSDWLLPADVPELRALLEAFDGKRLPERVTASLWHFESTARTYYVESRWPMLVTALEALVRVRDERDPQNPTRWAGSTKVFTQRVQQLSSGDPAVATTEDVLRRIYDRRSSLVHGLSLGALDAETRELYRLTEEIVRRVLRRCILDSAFADTFADDHAVQAAYPLA